MTITYKKLPFWLVPTTWFEDLCTAKRVSEYEIRRGLNTTNPDLIQASCMYMLGRETWVSSKYGITKEEAINNLKKNIRALS